MGIKYYTYLSSDRIFACKKCRTHLSTYEDIKSKNFRGQHGKAFLFQKVVNINEGEAVERGMTTGTHVVRDIKCMSCQEVVGWKYDKAFEPSQKYKEGMYILEFELLVQMNA
ncbi:yippee-like protein [Ascobolus immersus RN42]|uniref:Protein yippee-like n=1 Tax=Ascobolus immersus RN42 TaxID=1160509 RepID=A0A3N4IKH2_ASCIM|nr:yippee-like protein [Ascobolus immersus RN42]